ncbi:glycosyltransferase family 2 protein, partial [Candidatus Gottesmanbacteria bacterium]|nr:glycosyltransferase family 2 protein [Candidatus Gottesmanbacteria bacterium]
DVTLTKPGISKFVRVMEHGEPGIVGPESGSLDPKRWTTILYEKQNELHKATPCKSQGSGLGEQDYISGSFMAIHRNVWEATAWFYEPYFMYYEDADLCMRAKNLGFPLLQVKVDGFLHEPGKSLGKEYYLARNHLLFAKRLAPILVKIHELLRLPKTLMEHNQMENSEAIRGIGDFMAGRFGKGIT